MHIPVRDVMSHDFESIAHNAMIRDAAQRMRELNIGMLPVEEAGEIVGTITDRDITIRGTADGADPNDTPVEKVMSHELFTCVEDDDVQQAAQIMEQHQIRRLMVQNDIGDYVGMLSLADLARRSNTEQLSAEVLEEVSQPG